MDGWLDECMNEWIDGKIVRMSKATVIIIIITICIIIIIFVVIIIIFRSEQ